MSDGTGRADAIEASPFDIGAFAGAAAEALKGSTDAALKTARDAANAAVEAAKPLADAAGATAADAASKAGKMVGDAAGDAFEAFGGSLGREHEGNLRDEGGMYHLPDPILDEREGNELEALTKQYEKLQEPGALSKVGKMISDALPQPIMVALGKTVEDALEDVKDAAAGQELFRAAMKTCVRGFELIEERAAKYTVGPDYVLERINAGSQEEKVSLLSEICLLRAYDVTRIADAEKGGHLGLALAEGAATGMPGFAGLPFNLAFSMFLYFRAVQSVATFYGYDVKNEATELIIASDVLSAAMAPSASNQTGMTEYIGKIMAFGEISTVGQVVKKGWTEMAKTKGAALLITQIRALSNVAAKRALEKAGKKSLEENVFANVFKQIGNKLTQKTVGKAVPVFGGLVGALFDTAEMGRVLTYANVFYAKRFIFEKETRIVALVEHKTYVQAEEDVGHILDENKR